MRGLEHKRFACIILMTFVWLMMIIIIMFWLFVQKFDKEVSSRAYQLEMVYVRHNDSNTTTTFEVIKPKACELGLDCYFRSTIQCIDHQIRVMCELQCPQREACGGVVKLKVIKMLDLSRSTLQLLSLINEISLLQIGEPPEIHCQ